jgi:hypothetical protein
VFAVNPETVSKVVDENGEPLLDIGEEPAFSIGPKLLKMKPPKGITANTTESLPTWTIPKEDGVSLPKVLSTAKSRAVFYKRLDGALKWLNENPARITTASGWVKFLQKAGVWGEVPMPPMGLAEIINDPAAYVAKLNGGYHGEATLTGTQESARQGLDGTQEMRDLIGEGQAPAPFVVALHHMWGILSRMLPPLQQEGMWLRLISHRPVLDAIQDSLDGKFAMSLEEWQALVQGARDTTAEGAGQIGNGATANANSFHMMLERLNGRWQDMADVYSAPTSREMGRRFWDIGAGALGIKNKVQRFIGLTFGIPGVIMDRWKFVEFWLPTAMEGKRRDTPADYFTYGNNVPSDPVGIYGVYGSVDSGNEALSLAMYEAFETVLEAAIAKSPELQAHLGDHANPGGMHWHGWNAIKNEAVGHSSLDLTKELIASFGVDVTAETVHNAIRNGTYYTEGAETQQSNVKFFLDQGKIRVERTSVAGGLQPGRAGILGRGDGSGAETGGGGVQGAPGQVTGEKEARGVQARQSMTAEERAASSFMDSGETFSIGAVPSIIRPLDNAANWEESTADERNRDPQGILDAITGEGDGRGSIRADGRQRRKSSRPVGTDSELRNWTKANGRDLDPAPIAALISEENPKGGEHLVIFDAASGRVVKLTKPGFFGAQGQDAGAYVERWALHNKAFREDVAFEGMVTLPGENEPRAVISQNFAKGRDATPDEQRDYLIEKGFYEMPDGRWIHPLRGIVSWDTITPGNAILTADGLKVIDLQMAPAPADELKALRERTGIGRKTTFAIARADSPLLKAIDALVVAPEKKAEVYQKMAAKVREIRQRFDKKRLTSSLMDLLDENDPSARHEALKDIATLEAIAKTLPPAIRGKLVGSFRQLDSLASIKGREAYLIRLLPKIEQALENHLQNQFRMAIRREFDRGAVKVSESKSRGGKFARNLLLG